MLGLFFLPFFIFCGCVILCTFHVNPLAFWQKNPKKINLERFWNCIWNRYGTAVDYYNMIDMRKNSAKKILQVLLRRIYHVF